MTSLLSTESSASSLSYCCHHRHRFPVIDTVIIHCVDYHLHHRHHGLITVIRIIIVVIIVFVITVVIIVIVIVVTDAADVSRCHQFPSFAESAAWMLHYFRQQQLLQPASTACRSNQWRRKQLPFTVSTAGKIKPQKNVRNTVSQK